jgi:insertion element IS1 protein InsB
MMIILHCDEMWSFVHDKGNKQWIWLAIVRCAGPENGRIVGCFIGDRSAAGAKGLWDSIPPAYRDAEIFYSDFWDAYGVVLPKERHFAVGKESGKTNHIERFNGTMRARVSRLVRLSYAFSKKLENHLCAIWNFIHHYNASLPV